METIQAELRKSMHYLSMKKRDHAADKIDALQAHLEALTAELDALKLDAERYRWLQKQHWDKSKLCVVHDTKNNVMLGALCPSEKPLDREIDEAIAKGSEK